MQTKINKHSPAIELKDLSIIFDQGTKNEYKLFDKINYSFEANKIHFIAGDSGSGKTVLISHFNGLNKTKNGKIAIFGEPIKIKGNKITNIKSIRSKIGMVFQFAEYQLFKSTIEKDIIFGPLNFKVKSDEAKKRAKKYIQEVGLNTSFLPRDPFGLSGGQKRRVAIAGILAIEPDILVFDEPTAGLDPNGEKEMMNIFLNLKKAGKTIIIVTHSMNQAIEIADNVVVVGDGKILKSGTTYDIFQDEELIKKTSLSTPLIFSIIKKLIDRDEKYKVLIKKQPRTIEKLVHELNLLEGGKNA
ncbi:MAG: ATP-binding cassette domain-containing protein [Mycoplasmataceae bacterium]|jgi:energy-coupling factor transport system ATP-binding protein|nr:ATP-binding cassette domain-containing protein [Mycoplasmataceae bacterium]